MFKIKIKTKNGNDIKKKVTIAALFRLHYKKNLLTNKFSKSYTFRILHPKGATDCRCVLELRDEVESIEDFTLKVILNLCHIISEITQKYKLDPDFIIFISPEFSGKINISYQYLGQIFDFRGIVHPNYIDVFSKNAKTSLDEIEKLCSFVNLNSNTKFLNIDPSYSVKYEKSMKICEQIGERFVNLEKKTQLEIENIDTLQVTDVFDILYLNQ